MSRHILTLGAVISALTAIAAAQDFTDEAGQTLDIRDFEAADTCVAETQQLRITVDNIEKTQGILTVELYKNAQKGFLVKKGRLRRVRVPAEEGAVTVCMGVESEGPYAVAAYHDIDADRDLDQKWNRMPKEPFGLSNNPKLHFGFPSIKPSLVTVEPDGVDVRISLRDAE